MMASLETTDDGNEDNTQQPQIYAKDSLDRFGDDLFGHIVSYLSLEDRFRNECVSKQFQRTVFESVVDINIDDKLMSRAQKRTETLSYLFESIARKCPNIETIDCRGITTCLEQIVGCRRRMSDTSRDNCRAIVLALNESKCEILPLFRENCRYLRQIYCNLMPNKNHFFEIFGPLITRIDSGMNYSENQSLIHCHRLSQLTVNSLSDVFDYTSGLLVKNMQTFSFSYHPMDYKKYFSAFVAQNQSLKRLDLYVMGYQTHESMAELCGQLSRLPQLRDLTLDFINFNYQNLINDSLRTIDVNCKQLQRLSLRLNNNWSKDMNDRALDSLKTYRGLKRLDITLSSAIDDTSLEPLKLCHRLTHLTLNINTWEMSEQLMYNCDQYLPRLQCLSISLYQRINAECLSHISRLPALQMLIIKVKPNINLSYNDLNAVLSSSPKLKTIELREYKSNAIHFHNDLYQQKLVFI
ncbi:unnamed protein product [Medioppia subpectinata]|uniref:F-box domain-containing protein n=1 Tax=Medioppia subpectinata TaxID=1979941 RepID=A0A7R9KGA7_9ACAR|nr:unnamed protein product [Medioppia subpectinata]CAG2103001.1 unnamed protein product [Medioppia subpectinata]